MPFFTTSRLNIQFSNTKSIVDLQNPVGPDPVGEKK